MPYNENEELNPGDAQETDGVNHANEFMTDSADHREATYKEIVDELNAILAEPRFANDICVTLTMPAQAIKKARDKLNMAILKVYERHKSPEFKVFDVLVALESMVDAQVISSILDLDIKQMIAADRGITISDEQLEEIASGKTKKPTTDEMPQIVTCPKCYGTGYVHDSECPLCRGIGKVQRIAESNDDSDDYDSDDLDELPMGEFDKEMMDVLDGPMPED